MGASFPFEKIAYLKIAGDLDARLTSLLLQEISAGNFIFNAERAYWSHPAVVVHLRSPFKKKYTLPRGVEYQESADPHYNSSEYMVREPFLHILVAPFQ